jgi:hypothetical protein
VEGIPYEIIIIIIIIAVEILGDKCGKEKTEKILKHKDLTKQI